MKYTIKKIKQIYVKSPTIDLDKKDFSVQKLAELRDTFTYKQHIIAMQTSLILLAVHLR